MIAHLLLFASIAVAPLPDAPKPQPKHDYVDIVLPIADGALLLSDAVGTNRALSCTCNKEDVLPDAIAHHPARMYGFMAMRFSANWLMSYELKRHGHRKLARLPYIIDIGVEAPTLHNFTLSPTTKARF